MHYDFTGCKSPIRNARFAEALSAGYFEDNLKKVKRPLAAGLRHLLRYH